jgi:outer membrane usher protein
VSPPARRRRLRRGRFCADLARAALRTALALGVPGAPLAAFAQSAAQPQIYAQAPVQPQARATTESEGRLLTFDTLVNGARGGAWPMLERAGQLYAPSDAFHDWRLPLPPAAAAFFFRGQNFYPLNGLPGFNSRIDAASQTIELQVSPLAFSTTRLAPGGSAAASAPHDAALSALVFNYDLNYSAAESGSRDLGLFSEAVWSGKLGVLTHSSVVRNMTGESGASGGAAPRRAVRLETTYTRDSPRDQHTLRLGDSVTRPGLLGRQVFFGGAQIASNYSFTPGFTGQALPAVRGVSSTPSTVELYVNDVLRQVSTVPAGPFSIDNFPVVSASGEARIVVRDLLGRETVLVQPFFTHSLLLATGHSEWSLEAGRQRLDYGNTSNEYGAAFAAGLWRRGMSEEWTAEGRATAMRNLVEVAAGATLSLRQRMLGTLALAASRDRTAGSGQQWLMGLEHQGSAASFQAQARGATRHYRELGLDAEQLPMRSLFGANASVAIGEKATLGAGLVAQRFWNTTPRTTVASVNLGMRVGERASLNLNASRAIDGVNATALGLTMVVPLERRINAGLLVSRRAGQNDSHASASQMPPGELGSGWRVLAGHRLGEARAEAGLVHMGPRGVVSADLNGSAGQTAWRLGANGALVLADGHVFAARRIDNSFAVVEVPGLPDLSVGVRGMSPTRTDANGVALVNNLLPYQANPMRLDPLELPLSAEIDSIEASVVPAWRSAVKHRFPVRTGRSVLLRIVFDDGEAAPAGATLAVPGREETFYVARRGEAFVTGLDEKLLDKSRARLTWKGGSCELAFALPPLERDDIARVGPLTCTGVPR